MSALLCSTRAQFSGFKRPPARLQAAAAEHSGADSESGVSCRTFHAHKRAKVGVRGGGVRSEEKGPPLIFPPRKTAQAGSPSPGFPFKRRPRPARRRPPKAAFRMRPTSRSAARHWRDAPQAASAVPKLTWSAPRREDRSPASSWSTEGQASAPEKPMARE